MITDSNGMHRILLIAHYQLVMTEEKLADDILAIFSCVEIESRTYMHVQSLKYTEERNLEFHSLVTETSVSTF